MWLTSQTHSLAQAANCAECYYQVKAVVTESRTSKCAYQERIKERAAGVTQGLGIGETFVVCGAAGIENHVRNTM